MNSNIKSQRIKDWIEFRKKFIKIYKEIKELCKYIKEANNILLWISKNNAIKPEYLEEFQIKIYSLHNELEE